MNQPIRGCIRAGYILPTFDDYGKINNRFDRASIVVASQLPDCTETIFLFKSALPHYCSVWEALNSELLMLRSSFYLVASYVRQQTPEELTQDFNLKFNHIVETCKAQDSDSLLIQYEINLSEELPIWKSILSWLNELPDNAPGKSVSSDKSELIAEGCEYPSLMLSSKPGLFLSFDDFGRGALTISAQEDNPFYSICQNGKITTNPLLRPQLKFKGK